MLSAKVSNIKVGGGSELEMKERFDRYEDAVKAVQCALEEGIVEGGGVALFKIGIELKTNKELIKEKIVDSLLVPYTLIYPDSKEETEKNHVIYNYPLDNKFDLNIIDPLKVTRCALENAVSIAKTMLSTDAVVLNEKEWN